MTLIQNVLESSYTHRLGWALLHSLWQGAAVALFLTFLLFLTRRAAAQVRYVGSCAAMLATITLPVVTFCLPHSPAPAPEQTTVAQQQLPVPSSDVIAKLVIESPGLPVVAEPVIVRHIMSSPAAPPTLTKPPLTSRLSDAFHSMAPWLVLAWIAGVAALSLWNLGGWVALQRLKSNSNSTADAEICRLSDRLRRRLNLTRGVSLLTSTRIVSPMVIGVLKPVILLPASVLCELSPTQLESILAHEMAHIRRHDYLTNLLQSVIETLLFYHPAVWWIGRKIRIERENCCDDIALSITTDRTTYVTALTLVAARAPGLAPAAAGGFLLARVRRILGLPSADVAAAPRWLSGAMVLAVAFAVTTLLHPHSPAAVAATPPPQTRPATMTLTILDQESGTPIQGVSIGTVSSEKIPKTATDAAGIATLQLPRTDLSMNLWARKDGYVPTVAVWGNSKGQDPIPLQFTIKIQRGRSIGGTVVDEQGAPIAGAAVYAYVPRTDRTQPRIHTQVHDDKFTTDAKGQWRCNIIPPDAKNVSLRLEHPDYASDSRYGQSGTPSLDELLKMTDVLTMKKGLTLKGQVIDVQDKPIEGATVTLGQNSYGLHAPTARSDGTGHFVIQHCPADDNAALVVTAPGHCPDVEQFSLRSDKTDILSRLKPAKPLIVKVVNPQGQPLSNTRLFIQQWRRERLINWDARTDSQGRVVWNEAPDDTVYYCISHEGYVQQIQTPLVATGVEQTVTLLPELKVRGAVLDDKTGQPLEQFHVVKGWASRGRPVMWEPDRIQAETTHPGGKFEITEDLDRDGYAIRIEADGYMPTESKVFTSADGDLALTFRMNKASDTRHTLVTPDRRPLAGADVLVVSASSQIVIKNGAVSDPETFTERTKTDASGTFQLKPQGGDYKLIILHDRGFAELSPADLKGVSPITVPAWARIDGTARTGAKSAAGRTVVAMTRSANHQIRMSAETTVAADGSFRIDHVAPAPTDVALLVPLGRSGGMSSYSYEQRTTVEPKPGESIKVNIGGVGRAVTGRVVIPPSLAGQIDWVASYCGISSRLHLPARVLPPDWAKMNAQAKAAWNEQWRQTPEVRRYEEEQKNSKYFPVKLEPDGSFRVEDVVAGTYEFEFRVLSGSPPKQIGSAHQEFTVAPMPGGRSDQPLDLGTIDVAQTIR